MNNTEGFNIFDDSQRIAGEDLYEIVKEIKGENLYNSLYDSRSKFAKKIARHCGYKDHLDRTDFQAFSRALLQAQAKYSSFKWNERLWGTSILDQINPAELRSLVSKQSKSQLGRLTKRGQLRRDLLAAEIRAVEAVSGQTININPDNIEVEDDGTFTQTLADLNTQLGENNEAPTIVSNEESNVNNPVSTPATSAPSLGGRPTSAPSGGGGGGGGGGGY